MSEEKQWKSMPFRDRWWMNANYILIVILGARIIYDIRIPGIDRLFNLDVLIIVAAIGIIISSNIKIKSTNRYLEVILEFKSFRILWKDIESYSISYSSVTLYLKDSRSIQFGIRYLENRDEFIKYLENRIAIPLETTCLNCGERISDGLESCPKCNWTWKIY